VDLPPRGRPPPRRAQVLRAADLRADAPRQAGEAAPRQPRERARDGKLTATRLRQQVADADRRIKAQVEALEAGVEPELVTARIAELKADKAIYEAGLAEIPVEQEDAEADQLAQRLVRIPDLAEQLRNAPREVQRQTFEAFDLKIAFDKAEGRIEVSATVTEAVAQAFENTKALQAEGFQVTVSE
jgi:hypothetical protein